MKNADAVIRPDVRKFFASVMVCVLIFILASASFIVVSEADHECTGDSCPVCVLIHHCENIVKGLGTAAAAVIVSYLLKTALLLQFSNTAEILIRRTPVLLKTRINS